MGIQFLSFRGALGWRPGLVPQEAERVDPPVRRQGWATTMGCPHVPRKYAQTFVDVLTTILPLKNAAGWCGWTCHGPEGRGACAPCDGGMLRSTGRDEIGRICAYATPHGPINPQGITLRPSAGLARLIGSRRLCGCASGGRSRPLVCATLWGRDAMQSVDAI